MADESVPAFATDPAPEPVRRTITLPALPVPSVQTLLLVAVIGFLGYREYQGHQPAPPQPAPAAVDPAAVPVGKTYGGAFLEAGASTLAAVADEADAGKYETDEAVITAQRQSLRDALEKAWNPVADQTVKQFGANAAAKLDASGRAALARWYRGLAKGMRSR